MPCTCALCTGIPEPTQTQDVAEPLDGLWGRADAARIGMRPRTGAVPVEMRDWKRGQYPVFRKEDLVPKRKAPEGVAVPLLQAIFTVNRTAKRYRNKAAAHYDMEQFGFATSARMVKQHLYGLKDRGIVSAYRKGLIQATGTHGPLVYYEGGGYRFHSLLHPGGVELSMLSEETVRVEAKPKGEKESRLVDAEFTLVQLPADIAGFWRESFSLRRKKDLEEED